MLTSGFTELRFLDIMNPDMLKTLSEEGLEAETHNYFLANVAIVG